MRQLVIIGAGPAGMTAAVYAARKKVDCVIFATTVGGLAVLSSGIENYMGYSFISGSELMTKFEEQVQEFGIPIEFKQVEKITREDGHFKIAIQHEEPVEARAVIVATGRTPRRLNIPGEKEFVGRGVTYCATCDAPLFKNLDVAVIGGGNSALHAVETLERIANKVYSVSIAGWSGDPMLQERVLQAANLEVYKGYNVVAIEGDMLVQKIRIKSRKTDEEVEIPVRGVFFEIGSEPTSKIVEGLAPLNDRQEILVDCSGKTSVDGLFAAGDVTSAPQKQIIIAAGDGAKAALSAYEYLVRLQD